MAVTQKRNVGDTVYFMDNNKVASGIIATVVITVSEHKTTEYYYLEDPWNGSYNSERVFDTKDALIATL